jgi:hypothetical protein
LSTAPPSEAGALGGPVIIGGDDLTDHGQVDGGGNVEEGWLYIKRALESIEPNTSRGDGSIAALGSAADVETNSGAGAAITAAAQEVGLTVTFYDGEAAINGFFADLGGSADPSIIWIAGDGAGNDLDDAAEIAALTAGASSISSFVASGGGLLSHGSEFGWLTALLPGATVGDDGSSGDLYFTADGLVALPALAVSDINAGPWHNFFEGDFGGLDVLVRSADIDDAGGADAAVIIGGAQVTFEEQPEEEETEEACEELVPGIPCGILEEGDTGGGGGGGGGGGSQTGGTPASPSTPIPAATSTSAPAGLPTRPGGGQQGVITAPDTGSGGSSNGSSLGYLMGAALLAAFGSGAIALSYGAMRRR